MDLLDKIGQKKDGTAEGSDKKSEPASNPLKDTPSEDLLKDGGSKAKTGDVPTTKTEPANADSKNSSDVSKEDKEKDEESKTSWTVESALKEVKKLREENKQSRIKYATKIDELKQIADSKLTEKEQEYEELRKAKKELEDRKEAEADKKRTLEERLEHRSKKVVQLETEVETQRRNFDNKLGELQEELGKLRADNEAQEEVYKQRLEEELKAIPEKFQQAANLMVKGAGNYRDALIELSEAKINGIFDEKSVHVNHGTPGATDGARRDKKSIDEAERAEKDKMSPALKIRSALDAIKSGKDNSAFAKRQ